MDLPPDVILKIAKLAPLCSHNVMLVNKAWSNVAAFDDLRQARKIVLAEVAYEAALAEIAIALEEFQLTTDLYRRVFRLSALKDELLSTLRIIRNLQMIVLATDIVTLRTVSLSGLHKTVTNDTRFCNNDEAAFFEDDPSAVVDRVESSINESLQTTNSVLLEIGLSFL